MSVKLEAGMKLLGSRLVLVAFFCAFSAAPAMAACGRGVSPLRCLFASLHALRSAHLGPSDHRGARQRKVRFAAGHGRWRAPQPARRTRREALAVAAAPAAAHSAPWRRARLVSASAAGEAALEPAAHLLAADEPRDLTTGASSTSSPPSSSAMADEVAEDALAAASEGSTRAAALDWSAAPLDASATAPRGEQFSGLLLAPAAASPRPRVAAPPPPAPVQGDPAGALASPARTADAPGSERPTNREPEAANAQPAWSAPAPAQDQPAAHATAALTVAGDADAPAANSRASAPDAPAAVRGRERMAVGSGADAAAIRRLFGLSDHPADGTSPTVGAAAAPDLDVRPLPAAFVALRPYLADLGYFIADDRVILVFPATRLIVMTY